MEAQKQEKAKKNQDLLVSGITLTSSNDGNTQQLFELRSSNKNSTNILLQMAVGKSLQSMDLKKKITSTKWFNSRSEFIRIMINFHSHIVSHVKIFVKSEFPRMQCKVIRHEIDWLITWFKIYFYPQQNYVDWTGNMLEICNFAIFTKAIHKLLPHLNRINNSFENVMCVSAGKLPPQSNRIEAENWMRFLCHEFCTNIRCIWIPFIPV